MQESSTSDLTALSANCGYLTQQIIPDPSCTTGKVNNEQYKLITFFAVTVKTFFPKHCLKLSGRYTQTQALPHIYAFFLCL